MDTINSIVSGAGSLFEALLQQAHFSAVVLGFIVAMGLTQWAKGFIRLRYYKRAMNPHDLMTTEESVARHRLVVRSIASGAAIVVTFAAWPLETSTNHQALGAWISRTLWALAVGGSTPAVYWVGIRLAARFFPDVAASLSADSRLPQPTAAPEHDQP